MSKNVPIDSGKMVFRGTNKQLGRHLAITPTNSCMKHLAYGRIILNSENPSVAFSTGNRETGLICLSGEANIAADGEKHALGQYDAIYIPRDSSVQVTTQASVDFAEFSADVSERYPLQVVRFSEVSQDPGLRFNTGGSSSTRKLNMLLGKNVE